MLIVRDFVNYWSGAVLVAEGRVAAVFDTTNFHLEQERLLGVEFDQHYWSYPPHLLLLLRPLGWLNYLSAFVVWTGLSFAAFAWTSRLAARRFGTQFGKTTLFGLLVAPATMLGIWSGQIGLLTSALVLGGIANLDRRPVLSGFCFGLLSVKPQLGLLIPLLLIATRAWRAVIAAAGTTICLIALSALVDGVDPWRNLFTEISPIQRSVIEEGRGFFRFLMPSVFMAARLLELPLAVAYAVQLFVSAVALVAITRGLFRTNNLLERTMLVVLGTHVISPYTFVYDMPVLATLSIIYVVHEGRVEVTRGESWLWFAVWLSPALMLVGGAYGVPLGPLIMIAALIAVLRRVESSAADGIATPDATARPLELPAYPELVEAD